METKVQYGAVKCSVVQGGAVKCSLVQQKSAAWCCVNETELVLMQQVTSLGQYGVSNHRGTWGADQEPTNVHHLRASPPPAKTT